MSPVLSPSKVETTVAERSDEATRNDVIRIEFEIEDLVSRLAKSINTDADSFRNSCKGCGACSEVLA